MARGGLTNLRIDCEEELPLVSPDPGVSDPLDQLGVLVDQPGLPQHVGGRVLQLKHNQGNIRVRRNFLGNFLGKVLFRILHVPCRILTLFVSWVSIMKLWTCFSALVSSSFLETTATSRAVQPAPCNREMSRKIFTTPDIITPDHTEFHQNIVSSVLNIS